MIHKHFNNSLGFHEHKKVAVDLLEIVTNILDEYKIDYFLISGTLLGYVRHNDFIPYDDDMDLIVSSDIKDKLNDIYEKYNSKITLLRKDEIIKICFKDKVYNLDSFKIWSSNALNKKDSYFWPFIDLFIFNYSKDKKCLIFFKKEWNVAEFFPKEQKEFNDIIVSIPKNPDYFLSKNYGSNYMSILKSSSWNHKKEEPISKQHTITMDKYKEYIKTEE